METRERRMGRTDQSNFRLCKDLLRLLRLEAADRQVTPNVILEERLQESYEKRPLDITI